MTAITFAQSKVIKQFHALIENTRKKGNTDKDLDFINSTNITSDLFAELAIARRDTSYAVRNIVYQCIVIAGIESNKLDLRQQATILLLSSYNDIDKNIVTRNIQSLKQFKINDFSDSSKILLTKIISEISPLQGDIILLGGFIGGDLIKEGIRVALQNSFDKRLSYTCHLALARMGDTAEIHQFVNALSHISATHPSFERLLLDIIYTKSKSAYNRLFELMAKNEMCISSNPDNTEKIPCAFRIIEAMAGSINDFPVKLLPGGDLAGDYKLALEKTKSWYDQNKATYQIMTYKY